MDTIDRAQKIEQQTTEAAIATAKKATKQLKIGRCNYCDEIVEGTFCDSDCRADFEKEQRIRQARGEL